MSTTAAVQNGFLHQSRSLLSRVAPRLAVLGSGPGAFYTSKFIFRQLDSVRIDMFERLSEPFGLVNFGVAPDHPEVKNVRNEFRSVAHEYHDRFRLFSTASPKVSELREHYDGIVVAIGAQAANRLELPGSQDVDKGILSARDFVSWYNGHPDFTDIIGKLPEAEKVCDVAVIGHGNVGLDVGRILSKSPREFIGTEMNQKALEWLMKRPVDYGTVSLVGRRGYPEAKFTNKELREITRIGGVTSRCIEAELTGKDSWKLDRGKKRGLHLIEEMASNSEGKGRQILLRFHSNPKRVISENGKLTGLQVEHPDGSAEVIPCSMLIEAVRFKVVPTAGMDNFKIDPTGGFLHDGHGRVESGIYAAGWAKRGPTGIIAANIPCSQMTANAVIEDISNWKMLHGEGDIIDESDDWMARSIPSAKECRF
ncbi:hypothetical protein FOL47_006720 [Perkinsus chesapeaki]|uniref:NADPH:adrenodoxin oxidoreductase, mitochondrial n=1 Tax=Perkinsus chesapeaki TaxID=330153 RepID=A0A7J6MWW8_PERCH|nr:hypothetical protein FOL47_006720 [Perkinsus chesapeaki]